jgi:acylphosphatase
MQKTIELIIIGKVQGVWFRHHTREAATLIGVKGTVENLKDGTVRIVATGSEEQLDRLIAWCKKGSPLSRVDDIDIRTITFTHFESFH